MRPTLSLVVFRPAASLVSIGVPRAIHSCMYGSARGLLLFVLGVSPWGRLAPWSLWISLWILGWLRWGRSVCYSRRP